MTRFFSALSLAVLAGCSQPAATVDMRSAPTVLPHQMGVQGAPGAQGIPGTRRASRADIARCREANWRATGYRHGLSGFPLSALKQVSAACQGTGVKVDRLAYSTGRLEGLQKFCSAEGGYRLARSGQPLSHPCPPTLAKQFEAGYARGMAER